MALIALTKAVQSCDLLPVVEKSVPAIKRVVPSWNVPVSSFGILVLLKVHVALEPPPAVFNAYIYTHAPVQPLAVASRNSLK